MDFLVTNWIGIEGGVLIARKESEELCRIYPAQMIRQILELQRYLYEEVDSAFLKENDVQEVISLGKGGILNALWEMAERVQTGLIVDLRAIPVKQEIIEVCEYFDLNPYYLLSGGAQLILAMNGQWLCQKLKEKGIHSTVIGHTEKGNNRIIRNREHVRYLDRPQKEELYKLYAEGWNVYERKDFNITGK